MACRCRLGTTLRTAGSQAACRRVDHDYPLAVVRLAHACGTPPFVLNSAIGANADSRFFYNQFKGELESALHAMGFTALTLVRPGLIGGHREELRLGERLLVGMLRATGLLLPRRWRVNQASDIAPGTARCGADAQAGHEHSRRRAYGMKICRRSGSVGCVCPTFKCCWQIMS